MPRRFHGLSGGVAFHVFNRGNLRQTLFHAPADYDAFIAVVREVLARVSMRILAYVLMPNHWHLVLWPREDGDLRRFVGWLTLTHACRWQRLHGSLGTGPVYQGRYKAIPIEDDEHLVTVCVYVERNTVRAGLVTDARHWRWSSACDSADPSALPLSPWPIARPSNWLELVNRPETGADLDRVRAAVASSAPFGSDAWCAATIDRLGWRAGLRPGGRPRGVRHSAARVPELASMKTSPGSALRGR